MQLPNVRHPTTFKIAGVEIELLTFMPLTTDQAQRLAMFLWKSQPQLRKAKGKRCTVPWLGDAAALALLPPLPPQRR